MISRHTIVLLFVLASFVGMARAQTAASPGASPAPDPEQVEILAAGGRLLQAGKNDQAISECLDRVLAYFANKYRDEKRQIYCAGSSAESLLYLMTAANAGKNAIVLPSTWADAHYMKGFALLNLKRIGEATTQLERAATLSPNNAHVLSELGYCYGLTKEWTKSQKAYETALDAAGLGTTPEEKKRESGRALRGLGYVFVELGRLPEAEEQYKRCLEINPDDKAAKAELAYVRGLRNK